jgi:TPR repeat protein
MTTSRRRNSAVLRLPFLCLPILLLTTLAGLANDSTPAAINWCYQAYRSNNYSEAVSLCKPAAESGDANAAFIMASLMALEDFGVKDFPASVYWLEQAADNGHVEAAYNLGISYQNGHGVDQDFVTAAKWYRLSANDGSAKAQRNLAMLYENGEGLKQSDELAFYWYRQAAESGLPDSQLKIGLMYLEGRGISGSQQKGFDWIRKSAESGHEDAQLSLALLLDGNGLGEGIQWYEQAAERNNIYALHNLAVIYLRGDQVPQDLDKALAYAERSVELGNSESRALKQDIEAALVEAKVGGFDGPVTTASQQAPILNRKPKTEPELIAEVPAQPNAPEDGAAQRVTPTTTALKEPGWDRKPGWLDAQPSGRHTIQLAVTRDLKALYRFIRDNNLGDEGHIFQATAMEQALWVLVYGDYASRRAAAAAADNLPAMVRKDMWIRRFGEVKRQYLPQ